MNIFPFILLIFCHMIGDFVFQSNCLAKEKSKNWYALFVHSFLYSTIVLAGLSIVSSISAYTFIGLLITHAVIDECKYQGDLGDGNKALLIDQALHYIVIAIYYFI